METSKVESVVSNQAEAKLNQLEHSESAGTIRTSCKRDAIPPIRRYPLALPSGPITRGRSKKFKEALHGLVLSTQEMFKEEGNPAHEKLVEGLRDYIVNIIQVQD
ncbi:hypothetical protein F511_05635 [Dorcoceras hygrometricum]|uniref:Uncharacterized protein n=1 Tax=Dorcoceras hygrometricum TaxID=472368 RepID=A0A2Z7D2P1_9LAMI|nr:hypothetical protein F511_05635 [Dorcoceras hygrometricum]